MIERVIGIDFSGAKNAGKLIWISEAGICGGKVCVTRCQPASTLLACDVAPEGCLPALVAYIADQRHVVVGCDFPFSLPASMIEGRRWREFSLGFAQQYLNAAVFMSDCRRRVNGRERKRECDRQARVPFAAYNLRLYRQTFHGIRDFLAPLVRDQGARVLPMERPSPGRPWIIETCPASTLKSIGHYPSYKGRNPDRRKERKAIIDCLIQKGMLSTLPNEIRRRAIDDNGGDALDSIIAACATARCLMAGQFEESNPDPISRIEGRVYF